MNKEYFKKVHYNPGDLSVYAQLLSKNNHIGEGFLNLQIILEDFIGCPIDTEMLPRLCSAIESEFRHIKAKSGIEYQLVTIKNKHLILIVREHSYADWDWFILNMPMFDRDQITKVHFDFNFMLSYHLKKLEEFAPTKVFISITESNFII